MKARAELTWCLWLSLILVAFYFPLAMAEYPVSYNTTDSSPFRILDFDFAPREAIIGNASSQVTLQICVLDENSDIDSVEIVFFSPSGNQSKTVFMNSTNLFSGIAKDGSYKVNMSFSPESEEGIWTLYDLVVCDKLGDCKRFDRAKAETLGFQIELLLRKQAQNGSLISLSNSTSLQVSKRASQPTLDLDPNELRGWANTDNKFTSQRKIIINNIFNRPAGCWP